MRRARQIFSGGWLGSALSVFTRGFWPFTLPAVVGVLTLREQPTELTLEELPATLSLRERPGGLTLEETP